MAVGVLMSGHEDVLVEKCLANLTLSPVVHQLDGVALSLMKKLFYGILF